MRGVALFLERLRVVFASSSSSSFVPNPPRFEDKRGRMILISNIPHEETDESMKQYFSTFGSIENTSFFRHHETGGTWHMSITFSTSESASKAAGFRHKNVTVRLEKSRPTPPLLSQPKRPEGKEMPIDPEEGDSFEASAEHAFEDYRPVHYRDGFRHPATLVESSSLSSVDPPPITYKLALPLDVGTRRWISLF